MEKRGWWLGVLAMLMGWAVWAQEEAGLLEQLASPEAKVREQAHRALLERGPAVIPALVERMGGENKTLDLWARRTLEAIAYRSTRPGAEAERAAVERALIAVAQSQRPTAVRRFAIRLLCLVGRGASVPALATLLEDAELREPARCALEKIPDPAATQALVKAATAAREPAWKAALVKGLGARGDVEGRGPVLAALQDPDPQVRRQAIVAAGRLPHRETEAALWRLWEREKEAAAHALVALAERYAQQGQASAAEGIFRRLYLSTLPSPLRCASLYGLAQVAQEKALPELLAALEGQDGELRGMAYDLLLRLPGPGVTRALEQRLAKMEGEARLAAIRLLGQRGDAAAATLLPWAEKGEERTRWEALRALGNLRSHEAVPTLIRIVREEGEPFQGAAAAALVRIPGRETTQALLGALQGASPQAQAVLLRVLGQRADRAALPALREAARSETEGIRLAALEALALMPDASALPTVEEALRAPSPAVRNMAAGAAVSLSRLLEREGRRQAAVELCLQAARATTDGGRLRQLTARLQDLGASEALAEMAERNGFIVRWWVLGPIPNRGALRERDVLPTDQAVNPSQAVRVGQQELRWRAVRISDPLGQLDLERAVARRDDVGAYAYAEVDSDQEREVLFKLGSDDDVFCWLNGQLVHRFVGDRGWGPDQDTVKVRLQAGANRILLKVLNGGGGWAVSLRITDLQGNPLRLPQGQPG